MPRAALSPAWQWPLSSETGGELPSLTARGIWKQLGPLRPGQPLTVTSPSALILLLLAFSSVSASTVFAAISPTALRAIWGVHFVLFPGMRRSADRRGGKSRPRSSPPSMWWELLRSVHEAVLAAMSHTTWRHCRVAGRVCVCTCVRGTSCFWILPGSSQRDGARRLACGGLLKLLVPRQGLPNLSSCLLPGPGSR